jgi:transcription elongation GreA/GreB family factor
MNRENKQGILDNVLKALEAELERQTQANAQSNAATTFSASNADKQRDTTGYESAFLAHGYAKHCIDLAHQLEELKAMEVEDFTGQEVDIGALVEVEMDGKADWYLLLIGGGGIEVSADGKTVTVITPESPLGEALMGNIEAGFVELATGAEGIILSVF